MATVPPAKRHVAAVAFALPERQIDVPRDDGPRRVVVAIDELSIVGQQVLHGRDNPSRLGLLGRGARRGVRLHRPGRLRLVSLGDETREALSAVRKALRHHAPGAHVDGVDQDLPPQEGNPGGRDDDLLAHEERLVSRTQPLDHEVFDEKAPGQQKRAQTSDAHLAVQQSRRAPLRLRPHRGAEVDGDERDHDRGAHGQDENGRPSRVATPRRPSRTLLLPLLPRHRSGLASSAVTTR